MFANHPQIRVAVYIIALIAQVASFFVAIINPELAAAFVSTATLLSAVAGITALSNITPGQLPPLELEADYQARHARDTIAGH